jgi:hypothetical protein
MVLSSAALWADGPSLLDPRVLGLTALLAGTILVGAVIISWVDRWRKRQMADDQPVEQLTQFRSLYESGELTKTEYERIRSQVAERVRGEPGPTPPTPPAQSAPQEPPAPPSPE